MILCEQKTLLQIAQAKVLVRINSLELMAPEAEPDFHCDINAYPFSNVATSGLLETYDQWKKV